MIKGYQLNINYVLILVENEKQKVQQGKLGIDPGDRETKQQIIFGKWTNNIII